MLQRAIDLILRVLLSASRRQKSAVFLALDLLLIPAALLVALAIQPSVDGMPDAGTVVLVALPYIWLIGAGFLLAFGIPSTQLTDFDAHAMGRVAALAVLMALGTWLVGALFRVPLPPSFHLIFGTMVFLFLSVSRLALLHLVQAVYRRGERACRVLIYGAGTTGAQLAQALRRHRDIHPVAFVDDNVAIQSLTLAGLPVLSPVQIDQIAAQRNIERVLLAMPSLSPPKQARLARRLQKRGLEVQALPSFSQLIGREALVDKLAPVEAQAFLGRDEVRTPLGPEGECYADRCVLVSGAGGSIGSELCRQIIECRPRKLVLFELSEFALFTVEQELRTLAEDGGVEIVPVLGSVTNARQVAQVLTKHSVEVVLHAAAYKHVGLVQRNPLPGLANNVFGTQVLAQAAIDAGVERFILISSDKAVRPTGVMGASKRLAELVVQDLASRVAAGEAPIFAMVRFGNVLGSSGSVVPIFQEQIRRGGPVTVTHPKVTRYFMTIQEATRLVLRAGAMAEGGEVFLLDMGEPVRIVDLALQAIDAAGYTLRDDANPDGDIEIRFIGLRDGEKLHEELFFDGSERPTAHHKIFRVRERALSELETARFLRVLRDALAAGDEAGALAVVRQHVDTIPAAIAPGGAGGIQSADVATPDGLRTPPDV